jgi:Bacterial protein of unknown function (DUF885)
MRALLPAILLGAASCGSPAPPASPSPAPSSAAPRADAPVSSWIARSDENAHLLVDVDARFFPESASSLGVESADELTIDLAPGYRARRAAALQEVARNLEGRKAAEHDPLVLGDLSILLHEIDLSLREIELNDRVFLPYRDVARTVFSGIQILLDDRIQPARRARAVGRLRRYAGLVPGSTPITELCKADTTAALARSGLLFPARIDVEKSLSTSATLRDGIAKLFVKYGVAGHEEPMAALTQQLAAYDEWLRATILPRARAEFALPPEVYAQRLQRVGVDIPVDRLTALAHEAFTSIQGEMSKVAARIAEARHLPSADYRDVLRELKKEQLGGEAILPHYQARLAEIEAVIRRENLVTLPARAARIRLGSAAESAQQPAPHLNPPRLLGNTGEQAEFVLPLSIPAPTGSKEAEQRYDDFTFAAASWTLTAHEARPGHELQFDSMVERGTSIARARYAFNSANVEGWGLYAEAILLPYMPPEGQLVSLQLRLQRAVRAFIDPELQQGKWTFDKARDFLVKEVGLSPAFATAEVERYTFRMPGQATSYFYGFTRLLSLRKEVEARLGARFDARVFHDAIIGEGLLPPDLLRAAILKKLAGG